MQSKAKKHPSNNNITAKNYAAQAESSITKNAILFKKNNAPVMGDSGIMLAIAKQIKSSVHFSLPDNGVIFDDNLKGLEEKEINLPFYSITVETALINNGDNRQNKRLILASNVEDRICIISARASNEGTWMINPCMCSITNGTTLNDYTNVEFKTILPLIFRHSDESIEHLQQDSRMALVTVLELIEALSCTNVEISTHQPASPKNAQRIKSHKLPIYETKVLTIKAGKESLSNADNGIKGNHASPRQHLRRGHIRQLKSGNIWVNSCVVGSKEHGVIDKSYKVTA